MIELHVNPIYAETMSRKVSLRRMIGKAGDVAYDLRTLHFSGYRSTEGWKPDINAYHYDDRFEIFVDLAGVEKSSIRIDVMSDRLRISGERKPPVPCRDNSKKCRSVLTMEIESGNFMREVALPASVAQQRVTASQENGIVCIILPIGDR